MNRTPIPPLRKRIRFSFEVNVEYRPIPLDGQDVELARLRHILLSRPELMERLLGCQAMRALSEYMEGQARPNGLFGFEEEDLLEAAARSADPDDVMPLLAAIAGDWGFEYMEPVTRAPVHSQVASLQAVDLDTGHPIPLRPPSQPLLRRRTRSYLIAETENALVANASAYHFSYPGVDWAFEVNRTIDALLQDAHSFSHPLALIEFTIYAASPQEYELVKGEIERACRQRAPQTRLSFGWFTAYRIEVPLRQEQEPAAAD